MFLNIIEEDKEGQLDGLLSPSARSDDDFTPYHRQRRISLRRRINNVIRRSFFPLLGLFLVINFIFYAVSEGWHEQILQKETDLAASVSYLYGGNGTASSVVVLSTDEEADLLAEGDAVTDPEFEESTNDQESTEVVEGDRNYQPLRDPAQSEALSVTTLTKPEGLTVVGLVFYGRAERVSLLDCYLQRNLVRNGGWLDEVVWAVNTNNETDLAYLDTLLSLEPLYRKVSVSKGGSKYDNMWNQAIERGGKMYIKFDDDVVFLSDDLVPRLVTTKINRPDALMVSANMVNSPLMGWVHYRSGAIKPYLPELVRPKEGELSSREHPQWRASELPMWNGPKYWKSPTVSEFNHVYDSLISAYTPKEENTLFAEAQEKIKQEEEEKVRKEQEAKQKLEDDMKKAQEEALRKAMEAQQNQEGQSDDSLLDSKNTIESPSAESSTESSQESTNELSTAIPSPESDNQFQTRDDNTQEQEEARSTDSTVDDDHPLGKNVTWPPKHRWLPLPDYADIRRTPAAQIEYNSFGSGWTSWAISAQEHYSFLDNLERNEINKYHIVHNTEDPNSEALWDATGNRISINLFAIWGDDVLDYTYDMGSDDEQYLTVTLVEKTGLRILVDTRAVASHYTFFTQKLVDQTDILDRYHSYATENICPWSYVDWMPQPIVEEVNNSTLPAAIVDADGNLLAIDSNAQAPPPATGASTVGDWTLEAEAQKDTSTTTSTTTMRSEGESESSQEQQQQQS